MKKDERFDLLLRQAAKVFFEKGYDRASIRDVAREAGMSLAGLYYYFRSKEELLHLILEKVFTDLMETLGPRIEASSDPVERVRILIHNHIGYFVENLVEMKVLSHEYESLTGTYHEGIRKIRRDYFRLVERVVSEVMERGAARGVTARVAALSLLGMMNWLYTWYRPAVDGDAAAVAGQMTSMFLNGLLAGKGS
ncbi:MAG: TetR/AcrR family transcriptional regulator [Planctomycetes bacterium]|nr:TetR/AcrR family transcriptional regulator [Planctomycetota bacterium]